ncbi:MAG: hypothetical protein WB767_13945 [Nocardioides sp.]
MAGAPGLSALEFATGASTPVGVNGSAVASASCPIGKRAISVSAEFDSGPDGIQTRMNNTSGTAFGRNATGGVNNILRVTLLCATVS